MVVTSMIACMIKSPFFLALLYNLNRSFFPVYADDIACGNSFGRVFIQPVYYGNGFSVELFGKHSSGDDYQFRLFVYYCLRSVSAPDCLQHPCGSAGGSLSQRIDEYLVFYALAAHADSDVVDFTRLRVDSGLCVS